jgi:hypothetical protein
MKNTSPGTGRPSGEDPQAPGEKCVPSKIKLKIEEIFQP